MTPANEKMSVFFSFVSSLIFMCNTFFVKKMFKFAYIIFSILCRMAIGLVRIVTDESITGTLV